MANVGYRYRQRVGVGFTAIATETPAQGTDAVDEWTLPLLASTSIPGGIAAGLDFVSEYEGYALFDLNQNRTLSFTLRVTHDFGGGNQIVSDRTFIARLRSADPFTLPFEVFNARSQIQTGSFTDDHGNTITITEEMLAAAVDIQIDLILATSGTNQTWRIESASCDGCFATFWQLQEELEEGSLATDDYGDGSITLAKLAAEARPQQSVTLADATSPDTSAGTGGTATTAARSDHAHSESSLYADSVHTHSQYVTAQRGVADATSPDTSSGAGGSAATSARSDHAHAQASIYAEAAHTHPANPALADATTADSSGGAGGTATTSARSDHSHDLSGAYAPSSHTHGQYQTSQRGLDDATTADSESGAGGSATTAARSDHSHAKSNLYAEDDDIPSPSDDAPRNTATADAGSSADYARADHDHGISTSGETVSFGDATNPDTGSGSGGTAGTAARSDHSHSDSSLYADTVHTHPDPSFSQITGQIADAQIPSGITRDSEIPTALPPTDGSVTVAKLAADLLARILPEAAEANRGFYVRRSNADETYVLTAAAPADVAAVGAYATASDYRAHFGVESATGAYADGRLNDALALASNLLDEKCERYFYLDDPGTYRFRYHRPRQRGKDEFRPMLVADFASITEVDPEATWHRDAGKRPYWPYTRLRFTEEPKDGTIVTVTGARGWAAVPVEIKTAAIELAALALLQGDRARRTLMDGETVEALSAEASKIYDRVRMEYYTPAWTLAEEL